MTDSAPVNPTRATPAEALEQLLEGHRRFQSGNLQERDLPAEIADTAPEQQPFATILACMDSRVPPERIFDQGLGDIMSVRVAGHVVSREVLASLEFACEVIGTPCLVVLGHTRCGAVRLACDEEGTGDRSPLTEKIRHAVDATPLPDGGTCTDDDHTTAVARTHVALSIAEIRKQSSVLDSLEKSGTLLITGALYDVSRGTVEFLD